MIEKSAEMVGYSNNFGLEWSVSEVSPEATSPNQMPTELDEIRLSTIPEWAGTINRRSGAMRRSTSHSLKKVSAERHE